jgi:hypothetical protein
LPVLFRFDGMKLDVVEPFHVRLQVQYWLSESLTRPYFIGAHVDHATTPGFSFTPGGRLTDGVPTGQVWFEDNVSVDLWYDGDSPYDSSRIQLFFYPDGGDPVCSVFLTWGQRWARKVVRPGFRLDGIAQIAPPPSSTEPSERVSFAARYEVPPNESGPFFIGAHVPCSGCDFGLVPAGRLPDGIPKGQHAFDPDVVFSLHFQGARPKTTDALDVFIYGADGVSVVTRTFDYTHSWAAATAPVPPAAGNPGSGSAGSGVIQGDVPRQEK